MELMVTRIYGRFAKAFILVIVDGLGGNDAHSFYPKFFAQYIELVKIYSIGKLVTMLVKNIGSSQFGEQQLVTNYVTIFVIHAPDNTVVKRLIEIHNKRIEGQDFATNF